MTTTSSIHKPSKVDRARARLAEAVARLERALPTAGDSSADNVAKWVKYDELLTQFQTVQAENSHLKDVNAEVSKRLESAIDRFKQMIGS